MQLLNLFIIFTLILQEKVADYQFFKCRNVTDTQIITGIATIKEKILAQFQPVIL